jgi:hypothetical protein
MILYYFCLLPVQFLYVIINIQYLESHVQLVDLCAPWKFTSGVKNLVLQALQFEKLGMYCKSLRPVRVRFMLRLTVSWVVCLGVKSHLGPETRLLLLSNSCRLVDVGRIQQSLLLLRAYLLVWIHVY